MNSMRTQKNSGFALLLSLIISSVVLAIGVSILHISVNQINLAATARESELAFQAAHAGIDCQWYWRIERAFEYVTATAPTENPNISCFGENSIADPDEPEVQRFPPTSGTGYVDQFLNTFQWGSPARCTRTAMYVLNNTGQLTNMSVTFPNHEGVGNNGVKVCDAGSVCTVLISAGHNRACDELESTIFSVQRELTVEF